MNDIYLKIDKIQSKKIIKIILSLSSINSDEFKNKKHKKLDNVSKKCPEITN